MALPVKLMVQNSGGEGNRILPGCLQSILASLGTCAPEYNGTLENRTPPSVLAKDKRRLGT